MVGLLQQLPLIEVVRDRDGDRHWDVTCLWGASIQGHRQLMQQLCENSPGLRHLQLCESSAGLRQLQLCESSPGLRQMQLCESSPGLGWWVSGSGWHLPSLGGASGQYR
jgi:hypothetical protein